MRTKRKLDIEINQEVNDIITAVQNDTKSRYLDIQLFNNGVVVDLTEHKVRVYGFKADKKNFWNDCKIEDAENGRILLELTNQILALADVVHLQLKIYNNEETEILSTQIFKVWGTKDLFNNEAVESSNEYGSVVNLFQDVFEVRMQIKEILDKIGEPGAKGEELQKKTLFEQMEWLIDFNQKNSVGSLGEKIDSIIDRDIKKNWTSLPNLKIIQRSFESKNYTPIEINGAGKLIMAVMNTNSISINGDQSYKIIVDDEVLFDAEITFDKSSFDSVKKNRSSCQWGIVNTYISNLLTTLEERNDIINYTFKSLKTFYINSIHFPILQEFIPNESAQLALKSAKVKRNATNNPLSGEYFAFFLPVRCLIDEPISFKKNFKIETYNTNKFPNTTTTTCSLQLIYSLDE